MSSNVKLAEEVHKPVIKKFKRRKVSTKLKYDIRTADLTEMGLLSSVNKNVKYLLCVIDVFTKHAWVKSFKNKHDETFLDALIEVLNESNCKPNKLWVDQEKWFYNKIMQERLDINNILVSSIHNERKLIIAERFTETVKTKIYKKLTANYTKSYISYLNKLVDQYNNTYHHSINKKKY